MSTPSGAPTPTSAPTSTDTPVTIRSDALVATIAPLGAELQSLTTTAGEELLWDGDPAFWTGRAPILFPIVGAVAGDTYRLGDRRFSLPKHGFARRKTFALVEHETARAVFRLEADDATRAVYPFDFRLDVGFALDGAQLTMTADLGNRGATPMPACFGWHPAFRWPLPFGKARGDHKIRFAAPEPADLLALDTGGLIVDAPRATPVAGRDLALADALFTADALIWDDLASRRLVYGAPGAPVLDIGFPDMVQLGVWTKPGAPYLCIEPWHGHADRVGFTGELGDKPGAVTLAPDESRRFTMTVALTPPPEDFR
jgi:galactose mutarotase-like enzyme